MLLIGNMERCSNKNCKMAHDFDLEPEVSKYYEPF